MLVGLSHYDSVTVAPPSRDKHLIGPDLHTVVWLVCIATEMIYAIAADTRPKQ